MELLLSSSRLNFHMDVHECVQQDQHCNYIKMLLTELQIFFLDTNICKLSWLTYPWSFWGSLELPLHISIKLRAILVSVAILQF